MKGKKKRKAVSFLTGGNKSFLTASTLLTAVGVGWGLYETMKPKTTVPGSAPPWGGGPGAGSAGYAQTPPPPIPGSSPSSSVPPLPGTGNESAVPSEPVPAELLRLVRLTISASRADGELSHEESEKIREGAREAGAEHLIDSELRNPRPLAEIVSGPLTEQQKRDLYVLAFTIARADEGVSGAEKIYLAQLAHLLALDVDTTDQLERETIARMDAR